MASGTDAGAAQTGSFVAPGPGSWLLDAVHVPRPFSRFQAEIHPPSLAAGFRAGTRRYGLLLDTLEWRMVEGFAYFQPVPAPAEEIPARFAAAEQACATRLWRHDLARWDDAVKPAAIAAHRRLQAVDPAALSDAALLAHVEDCRAHLVRMVEQHHSFNLPSVLPVGDLMAHVAAWTDLPLGAVLALMRGAAPESAGAFPELDRMAAAIRADRAAGRLLASAAAPAAILAGLRAAPGETGAAAAAYLDLVEHRLLDSLDCGEPSAIEVPEVLVEGIRVAVEPRPAAARDAPAGDQAGLRDRIPARHRDEFDALVAEARLLSRLRDERGLYSDVWAGGLMRRALLAAGARLAAAGRIAAPAHLAEGGAAEVRALMRGEGGPSAAELARRAAWRSTARAGAAPPFLGEPPHPPPPLDGLPPPVQRLMRALDVAIGAIFAPAAPSADRAIRGTGASPGVCSGVARVIDGPAQFGRLARGDVLVTATTTEAFNVVLPLLGAIVTDTGGLLSHAAIVAREYGIPGVVGCRDATARIADGARVRVDGAAGEVRILDA